MESIRVLQVTGAMNIGGTESMLMNIYRAVDRSRIQFDFLSFNNQEAHFDKEIQSLGGRVIKSDHPASFKQLYDLIKKGKYAAVHAHTLFHSGIVMAAAKAAGVPVRISHAHTTKDNVSSFQKKLYVKTMQKLINQFSSDFLTCSVTAGNFMFGHERAEWLPNMIQTEKFLTKNEKEIEQFKLQYGLQNKLVIGHVGRFMEAKNHLFLLDLLAEIKTVQSNAVLLLVGDGDLKEQVEAEAERLKLTDHVVLTGALRDTSTALHAMDVFVFPSKYEGLGLVLLEAQAAGIPCVTSDCIQPEADAGIGLLKQLSLQASKAAWIAEIREAASQGKHPDAMLRERKLNEKGYSIEKVSGRIAQLYMNRKEGKHEKTADRVF